MDKNLKHYDDAFYKQHEAWTEDYAEVSNWIYKNIVGDIFGDVGCGNAYMISNLHKMGKKIWGVDAAENFEEYVDKKIRKYVKKVDLTQNVILDKSDVALCFEVAEHIEKKFANTLIKNIIGTKAGTILFTAARPGQDGTHHINLQSKGYWLKKFSEYGYCHDAGLSEKFKSDLAKSIKTTTWYLDNIIVLQKCDDRRMESTLSTSEKVIEKIKDQAEKFENENIKLRTQLETSQDELHRMKNSKRWLLSSKAIRLIRR